MKWDYKAKTQENIQMFHVTFSSNYKTQSPYKTDTY